MKSIGEIVATGQTSATRQSNSYSPNSAASRELIERIDNYMQHFWVPEQTAVNRAYVLADWTDALKDIPFMFVDQALKDWTSSADSINARGQMIKPAPAKIRLLAKEAQRLHEWRMKPKTYIEKRTPEPDPELTPEERQLMAAKIQALREWLQGDYDHDDDQCKRWITNRAGEILAERNG